MDSAYVRVTDDFLSVHHRFWYQDHASPFSNHCCERGGVGAWHSRERVVITCLPLRLASHGLDKVLSYLLDKFWERLINGAITGPPLLQTNKTWQDLCQYATNELSNIAIRSSDVKISLSLRIVRATYQSRYDSSKLLDGS